MYLKWNNKKFKLRKFYNHLHRFLVLNSYDPKQDQKGKAAKYVEETEPVNYVQQNDLKGFLYVS